MLATAVTGECSPQNAPMMSGKNLNIIGTLKKNLIRMA